MDCQESNLPADHPDYVVDIPFATAVVFLDQRPAGQRDSDGLTSGALQLRPSSRGWPG